MKVILKDTRPYPTEERIVEERDLQEAVREHRENQRIPGNYGRSYFDLSFEDKILLKGGD